MLHDSTTWVAAAFILFMGVFIRYALPHIVKGLDHRSEHIKKELNEAIKLRDDAQAMLTEYQRKQKEMKAEAESLVKQAQKDVAAMREQAEKDIQDMMARRTDSAKNRIARAEMEAIADIRQHMAQIAINAAEDILKEDAQASSDDPYFDGSLENVSRIVH